MRLFYVKLVLSIVICSGAIDSFCQGNRLIFNVLSLKDNLTSQKFNDYILTDSRGTVWISSIDGLNRFEGGEILQTPSDPSFENKGALAEPNIQSNFFEDGEGNIWFNTSLVLHRFNRKEGTFSKFSFRNTSFGLEKYLDLIYVDSIAENLWFALEDRLFISSFAAPTNPLYTDSIPKSIGAGPKITHIKGSAHKFLFIPTRSGCNYIQYDPSSPDFSWEKVDSLVLGYPAHVLLPVSATQLLIGTDSGLIHKDLDSGRIHSIPYWQKDPLGKIIGIHALGEDRYLLVSSTAEVFVYHARQREIVERWPIEVKSYNNLFPEKIRHSYLDEDKTLWLSSENQGVYFTNLDKRKFNSFLPPPKGENKGGNDIIVMAEDADAYIWCLTGSGIRVIDSQGKPVTQWDEPLEALTKAYGESPYHLFCDTQDRIWVCSSSGVFVFFKDKRTYYSLPNPAGGFLPTYCFQLQNGDLWIASLSGILQINESGSGFRLDPIFPEEDESRDEPFSFLHEWVGGKIVASSPYKSIRIYAHMGTSYVRDTLFELPYMINGVAQDPSDSSLWITTSQGLFHLQDTDNGYQLSQNRELPSEPFMGILQENDSTFWISSLRGLIKYQKNKRFWSYGLADGLAGLQFQFWSYLKHSNGAYLFGGLEGLTHFFPSAIQPLSHQARPTLSAIWINDSLQYRPFPLDAKYVSLDEVDELRFPYRRNTLSFRLAAREYSDPGSNHYRFQLVGLDDSTVNLRTESFVRYPNLSPNTYTLRLEASNSDGLWSPERYELKIIIDPPWYRTWWFYTIGIGFLLSMGYLWIRLRIQNARKDAEHKQQVAEIETAVLKLQMNPHFIFNSLGSIQNSLMQEDTDKAHQMLDRFESLIRRILDYSDREHISLTEEIELLEKYVFIEAMRFKAKINFEVDVDPGLDPDEIPIPPMILQPFVENAIKHGFHPQSRETGKIDMYFSTKEPNLLCIIRDNGIGREEAALQSSSLKSHISRATEITKRRLALLEEKEKIPTRIEVIDLKDANDHSQGTEVRLFLPLIQ